MDWYQIAALIVTVLFGGQGIRAWIKTKEAKKNGRLPKSEDAARQTSPAVQYLTDYYQNELDALRGDLRRELAEVKGQVTRLTSMREEDADYIDELEAHIWEQKPPPPPRRRRSRETQS